MKVPLPAETTELASPAARANKTLRLKSTGLMLLALLIVVGVVLLLANQPSPATEAVEKGKQLADRGQLAEAERLWKEAADRDPNCADAWAMLGRAYQSDENFTAAVDAYRHLARLKPNTPRVFQNLGSCVVRSKSSDADAAYQQALKDLDRDPNDLAALTIASTVLTYHEDQKLQLTYLRRMAKLRPNDPDFLTTLAQALVNARLYDEARDPLDKLIALAPNSPAGYDLRGRRLLLGDGSPQALTQAESDFHRALQLSAASPLIHLNMGRVYIGLNQPGKALPELQAAAQSLPVNPDIYYELSQAYALAKRPKEAAAAQAKFVELRRNDDRLSSLLKRCPAFPNDFNIRLETAQLMLQKGDLENANYYLGQALALRPNDPRAKAAARQINALAGEAQSRP